MAPSDARLRIRRVDTVNGDRLVTLDPQSALTIRRILKVNHAGEHGAIRIYRAQIAVARWCYPELVPVLSQMLGHEIEHHRVFLDAMPSRAARPCRVMALWSLGGSVLDFVTALLGRQAIWTCTAAVESAVHRHLDDQIVFLEQRDPGLHEALQEITSYVTLVASFAIAERFNADLKRVLDRLAVHPGSGAPRPRLGWDIRIAIVTPYVFVYRHTLQSGQVSVLRVVQGRRKIIRRLLK